MAGHHQPAPPDKGPFQPELSDCKRQFASEAVWARITQGEHLLAPRIIENHLSTGDLTWHRRRDNMWHFYNASPAKPHYAALRELLNAHADNLAAAIDRLTPDKPGKRHLSLGVTGIPRAAHVVLNYDTECSGISVPYSPARYPPGLASVLISVS